MHYTFFNFIRVNKLNQNLEIIIKDFLVYHEYTVHMTEVWWVVVGRWIECNNQISIRGST